MSIIGKALYRSCKFGGVTLLIVFTEPFAHLTSCEHSNKFTIVGKYLGGGGGGGGRRGLAPISKFLGNSSPSSPHPQPSL